MPFPVFQWEKIEFSVTKRCSYVSQRTPLAQFSERYHHVVTALPFDMPQVKPFINEAHYFADATLMFPVWPPEPKSVYTSSIHQAAQQLQQQMQQKKQQPQSQPQHTAFVPPTEVTGWGVWLAERLWNEVQWRVAHSRHCMQG